MAKILKRRRVGTFGIFVVVGALGLIALSATSYGQANPTSRGGMPVVGSTDKLQIEKNVFAYGLNGGPNVHRDAYGKPCIRMLASSATTPANDRIFTHQLLAVNNCIQPIKVSVCYYGSSQCQMVSVSGFGRKGIVLGVYPALKDFRYQYTERF